MFNLIVKTRAGNLTYDIVYSSIDIEDITQMQLCFESYLEYLDLKYENAYSINLKKMLSNWENKYHNKKMKDFVKNYFVDKYSDGVSFYFVIIKDKFSEFKIS